MCNKRHSDSIYVESTGRAIKLIDKHYHDDHTHFYPLFHTRYKPYAIDPDDWIRWRDDFGLEGDEAFCLFVNLEEAREVNVKVGGKLYWVLYAQGIGKHTETGLSNDPTTLLAKEFKLIQYIEPWEDDTWLQKKE